MPSLNTQILSDVHIFYPPLPEQRAIAHILSTLDDKIELNRRMNETLDAMARALFKSWFVDFDPVHAKAALRRDAARQTYGAITPPLRGSRRDKGASPLSNRWGDTGAAKPPRPWSDVRRRYTSRALHHARSMRQNPTNPEGLLWHYLRNKQLGGYKFRRQQPIGPYIADFACLPAKLLIELDGGQHADPSAPERAARPLLAETGLPGAAVLEPRSLADCFGVLERVYEALADPHRSSRCLTARPPLLPLKGGVIGSVERARAYLDRMDPEIAALFPDHFVNSELGEIPAGWEVKALGEAVEVVGGTTPSTKVRSIGIEENTTGQRLRIFRICPHPSY